MVDIVNELRADAVLRRKIQKELPQLFHIAELESSRAGKIGMEVGSVRERILVALFIYKFGTDTLGCLGSEQIHEGLKSPRRRWKLW